jgi:hypothetical protein
MVAGRKESVIRMPTMTSSYSLDVQMIDRVSSAPWLFTIVNNKAKAIRTLLLLTHLLSYIQVLSLMMMLPLCDGFVAWYKSD